MPVKVEVKLDVDSMADFMVYNIYTSGPGMVALILGVLNMGLAVSFIMKGDFLLVLMFLAFAFLILGIFPYLIRRKVAKQMQNSKKLGALVTYELTTEALRQRLPMTAARLPGVSSRERLPGRGLSYCIRRKSRLSYFPSTRWGISIQQWWI